MGIAGVDYDASAGIMQTAMRFKSTIIPMVIDGGEFWFLLFMNIAICILRHLGIFNPEVYHIDLPFGLTGVTGSLMTFFVCFYNQHVFSRYQKIYSLTKRMSEDCIELVSILRLQVEDIVARRKIAKLVIASCLLFFYERTEGRENSGNVSSNEYQQLKQLDLLGDAEIQHLTKHATKLGANAVPSFIVQQWAMELMRLETANPEERDDMLGGFFARVYRVRKNQAEVVQILELPMPFQYFHIMNLMLALNLVLWAYSLGCQDSFFAPIIFMFVQMMFQGIRELSTALSDPFGDDEVDFPVNAWMMTLYARTYALLEDPYDVTKTDLDKVTPLLDPEKAKEIISMYVDIEAALQEEKASKGGYRPVSQKDDEDELMRRGLLHVGDEESE